MFRVLFDTCVLFKPLLCDTVLSLAEDDLYPAAVRSALRRQVSRYRRAPRSVEDLLIALGNTGNGCPGFARACLNIPELPGGNRGG